MSIELCQSSVSASVMYSGRRRPAGQSHFWAALTSRVMRDPGLSALLAGGLLVALAIPALQLKIVTSGVEQLPQDIPIIVT
jgi:RND superfamily putative drug exporter